MVELKFDPDNPKYEFIKTVDEANEAIKKLKKEKIIAIDTETTGLDPYTAEILLVQIGDDKISYIFDARKINFKELKSYKGLLEDKKILKLLQNAKFDYKMIKVHHGVEIANIYDTMLSEDLLTAGLGIRGSGLKALAKKYVDIDLNKEIRNSFLGQTGEISNEQLAYGAVDTLILFPIFQQQWPQLRKENLLNIAKLEFAVTGVVGDMEVNGIYVDKKRWRKIIKNLEKKRTEYAKEFQEAIKPHFNTSQLGLFGGEADSININSQVQLMNLFNNKLGLNIPSTGVGIMSVQTHPLAKLLMKYRGQEKLISSFGESLLEKINPVTNRLHPNFMQLRTATGRFACSNPNLQQIPRNSKEAPFRECFNPQPGYKLVTADYSSFEMRILAELSGDRKMIDALKNGLDMHSYTASVMFGKEYSKDFKKKYPELRQAAKAIGFGLMYGMSANGLAAQIDVTRDVALEYMDKYFNSFPSVKKFLDGLANSAVRNGWSETPGGRKRWYKRPEKSDPDYKRKLGSIQRQAKNHPIQGTNADAVKYALVFLADRIKKEGADVRITHTVHDEIVCEVRNDQAEAWAKIQSEEMERAGELYIKSVPVISEPFVGDVWEH